MVPNLESSRIMSSFSFAKLMVRNQKIKLNTDESLGRDMRAYSTSFHSRVADIVE